MSEYVNTKALPENLRKLLPSGYRKRTVRIVVTDSVSPFGYWWDGGSRTDWSHYRKGQRQSIVLPGYPFTESAPSIEIDEHNIVVTSGTFCGKTATACIYVNSMEGIG